MKILCIGGTGTISTSFVRIAYATGHEVTIICRGTRNERTPKGVRSFKSDAYNLNDSLSKEILNTDWDCVINWTIYTPDQAQLDIKRFGKNTAHYIFISS